MKFLTTILDEVNKLIDEHGSANILRERVKLAKDQGAAQEKRIVELSFELEKTRTEIATLRHNLEESQQENERLKNCLNEFHKSSSLNLPTCPNCSTPEKPIYMRACSKDEIAITGQTHVCPKCFFGM